MRQDDPARMKQFEGACYGGKALIILGGESGKNWKELRDEINPDVILGANGTIFEIDDLDFHLVVENLHMAANRAGLGDGRYARIAQIISPAYHAKVRLISFLNWKPPVIVDSRVDSIKIKRMGELGDDYESQFASFSFREYGAGFLAGPIFNETSALTNPKIKYRTGTVGTQLLHLAGILGVKEVYSIGMDFCGYGHFYKYPLYQPDRFRSNGMFIDYNGLQTQHDWLAGGIWLRDVIEPLLKRDGLKWHDRSNGLLSALGLECAK